MKRLFWLAMGVTIGVLVVRRITRAAEQMSPRGMKGRAGAGLRSLTDSIRDFVTDVRTAMSEREAQLREAAQLDVAESRPANTVAPKHAADRS